MPVGDDSRRFQLALRYAPPGTDLETVDQVAQRLIGSTDEELSADAEKLYGMIPPPVTVVRDHVDTRELIGGGNPEESRGWLRETPSYLASKIPRGQEPLWS
ncbi:hypothetical protein BJF85_00505 [Saccharomonospora sp. CUA-673]|nr:hypothetical protein BJF85_00505 [Saccharomonospora sp. CUA-673]